VTITIHHRDGTTTTHESQDANALLQLMQDVREWMQLIIN
jgi:hypothetical protein